jgi:radical SAM superfamily enzyme YgiQ (UPF0313 family)
MERKRILLVHPKGGPVFTGLAQSIHLLGYDAMSPVLSLGILAAYVDRSTFEVRVCDEFLAPVDFDTPCDLVAITAAFFEKERAKVIADQFHGRGKTVVLGGPWPTTARVPDWEHFDAVFVGEAETTWPAFLEDYLEGKIRAEYRSTEPADLGRSPAPDLNAFENDRYAIGVMQIGRGCPLRCEFCDITARFGSEVRAKGRAQIERELEDLHRLGYRFVNIVDENFAADRTKCIEALEVIGEWNRRQRQPIQFAANVGLSVGRDAELLELMSRALVLSAYVGIESPNIESLPPGKRRAALRGDVHETLEAFQRHGIDVTAGMILGFDHDRPDIFERQREFLQRSAIPVCYPGILVAVSGTPLTERLIREGRYLGEDILCDHTARTNYIPRHMTMEQLQEGFVWLLRELYRGDRYLERVERLLSRLPAPTADLERYRHREAASARRIMTVACETIRYYLSGGRELRVMLLRFAGLMLRHWPHRDRILYWMIAHAHFRIFLEERGQT